MMFVGGAEVAIRVPGEDIEGLVGCVKRVWAAGWYVPAHAGRQGEIARLRAAFAAAAQDDAEAR